MSPTQGQLKIAAIQHDIIWQDRDANLSAYAPQVGEAAADGARLIVLSEMFATGFSMETDVVAEAPDGPSVTFLIDQAAAHDAWLCATVPVRDPDRPLPVNRLILAGPGGELHHYDKIHPFSYGGEDQHYSPGTCFLTVDIDGLAVSPFVCYDLRFADEFWGLADTTDVYLVPANWPAKRRAHWRALLVARAIENQAYVVGVNRIGEGGGLDYSGDSLIISPLGDVLADGGESNEETLTALLEADVVTQTRDHFPFLQDRR